MSARPIVLLDLDNTILDFTYAERRALSRTLRELGLPDKDAILRLYHEINREHWAMLERGEITRERLLVARYEALFAACGLRADAQEAQRRYEGHLSEGHWFLPGAEALLERLQAGCRLFLCSNGNASVQAARIASADLEKCFEALFISESLGADKPSPLYFERCFARIPDFRREDAIILGDSLSSDVLGGRNAGIASCWFNPDREENRSGIVPDHEIHALEEFPPLLNALFGTAL